jgi:hypothetical protein
VNTGLSLSNSQNRSNPLKCYSCYQWRAIEKYAEEEAEILDEDKTYLTYEKKKNNSDRIIYNILSLDGVTIGGVYTSN